MSVTDTTCQILFALWHLYFCYKLSHTTQIAVFLDLLVLETYSREMAEDFLF